MGNLIFTLNNYFLIKDTKHDLKIEYMIHKESEDHMIQKEAISSKKGLYN
jgi:hypothetical protein